MTRCPAPPTTHRDSVEAVGAVRTARTPGDPALLQPGLGRRPDAVDLDAALHPEVARPEGRGHPDGARLHPQAVRPGRALGRVDDRERLRRGQGAGGLEELGERHLEERHGPPRRVGQSRAIRPWAVRSGCGPMWRCPALQPSDVEVQAVYGQVDADNRLTTYEIMPLKLAERARGHLRVRRRPSRWTRPVRSVTPSGCCRTTRCWPPTPNWGWSPPPSSCSSPAVALGCTGDPVYRESP